MKKVLPLGFLILVSVLTLVFVLGSPFASSPSLKLFQRSGLAADKAATYQIRLHATQKAKGQAESTLAVIAGKLTQYEESPGVMVSRWTQIDELTLKGHVATAEERQAALGKAFGSKAVKASGYEQYLAKDFPQDWFRLQLNLLQRLSVPSKEGESAIFQRHEKEEMGQYLVEYTHLDKGDYLDVKKQFISYENPQITMDRSKNTVHYQIAKNGRLISAEGDVGFTHEGASGDSFVIHLTAALISVSPSDAEPKISLSDLELADDNKIRLVATENRVTDALGFEEAMDLLSRVSASTDGRDLYLIYAGIKAELQARPDRAILVRDRILSITDRDEGSRRQVAAAFGALAQSEQPTIANVLANLARDCADLFCKDQAIVALNDHSKPTPESARKILDIVKNPGDADVASAAVLALGSIAHKIGPELPEISEQMIQAYKNPENQGWKRSILAGMGNHGDKKYLPILIEGLQNPQLATRASSLYSFRHLKGPKVNEIITAAIEREKEAFVINEGLKAAAYRRMPAKDYDRMAARISKLQNEEEAKEATRLFMKLYESDPTNVYKALTTLRERSRVLPVKSVIARKLEGNRTF